MAEYDTITDLDAGSALDGTEIVEFVQSSASVKMTGIQIRDYIAASASAQTVIAASSPLTSAFQALAAGTANTVQITGEYQLSEDNELDYSASITDAMSAQTITISELPVTTKGLHVWMALQETGQLPAIDIRRTSGGTQPIRMRAAFADRGTNILEGTYWIPTEDNTFWVASVTADVAANFVIIGYKTGA